MAFTGTVVVEKITDSLVRITGAILGVSAAGTIGLNGDATADIQLPDGFDPKAFASVSVVDALDVSVVQNGGGAPLATFVYTVAKAASPFQFTVTNLIATTSGHLEMYVRYH